MHIRNMKSTLQGGLMTEISNFIREGDQLNPELWAGGSAEEFYAEWPSVRASLTTALDRLNQLNDGIIQVNTNIQEAGGNVV